MAILWKDVPVERRVLAAKLEDTLYLYTRDRNQWLWHESLVNAKTGELIRNSLVSDEFKVGVDGWLRKQNAYVLA